MARRAFTLVELLVVVAVIMVLLALLMPAMEGAVYQARLARCSSNIRAVCMAAAVYVTDYQQWYPPHAFSGPHKLRESGDGFRPILRRMVPIDGVFNDPLSPEPLGLDASTSSNVQSGYANWFGWGYSGEQKMEKFGQRWTYTSPANSDVEDRFSVIVSDALSRDGGTVYAGHNGTSRTLPAETARDANYTLSRWTGGYSSALTFDMSFGYEDVSVRRHEAIRPDVADTRLARVPCWSDKMREPVAGFYLPQE